MKVTVGVIFGGESVEHEISIISALQAMHAMDEDKYDVIPLYISKKRVLYSGEALKNVETFRDMDALFKNVPEVYLSYDGTKTYVRPIRKSLFRNEEKALDIVIPVVHGTNCEDGTVQGYLEMMHVPYAGCDVVAGGVGQDKVVMKYVLQGSGLPMTKWFWLYGHQLEEKKDEVCRQAAEIGYPLILKPACCGSSVGIEVVHNEEELLEKIPEVTKFDRKVLIEELVTPMVEINCSVLGDCYKAEASTLEQVMKNEEILSYQDKYGGNSKSKGGKSSGMASTSRIVPAPLSEQMTSTIKDLALKSFMALGASGVCRIDFLINSDTNAVYVNEINTIPGSLAFYLWEESGVSFSELMDRLVRQAIDRQRRREKMTYSYDVNILSSFAQGGAKGKAKGK